MVVVVFRKEYLMKCNLENIKKQAAFILLICNSIFVLTQAYDLPCSKASFKKSQFNWDNVAQKKNIIPIAVIGSGPAGLSAAMYGARGRVRTIVFEGEKPGGLLTETSEVKNWPGAPDVLGPDVMDSLREQACGFGVQVVADIIEEVDFSRWPFVLKTMNGDTVHALTVVISTGAAPRKLGIKGEQEYWGRGVSACARCDAPLFKDKVAVVIGGGDSAIEEAQQLTPYAKKVTIIHRRDKLRAAPQMQDQLSAQKNIDVIYNAAVKSVIGDDRKVTKVELIDTQTKEESAIPIDGLFLAIGHIPNTDFVKKYIDTDNQGFVWLQDRSQATNVSGVFAAGDVADPIYRQAGTAAGDGIKAGVDALNFLHSIGYTGDRAQSLESKMFDPEGDACSVSEVERVVVISNKNDFDKFISKGTGLSAVLFYKGTESPSPKMMELLQESAQEVNSSISFALLDTLEQPSLTTLSNNYSILKTPSLLVFSEGKLVARFSGIFKSSEAIVAAIGQISSN